MLTSQLQRDSTPVCFHARRTRGSVLHKLRATLPRDAKELDWRLVGAVVPRRLFRSAPVKTLQGKHIAVHKRV